MKLKVKILDPRAKMPVKNSYDPSCQFGIDFFALEHTEIGPRERKVVRTGVAVQICLDGHEDCRWNQKFGLILKDKSGISCKKGLHSFAGVIDADYTGEILAGLYNMTDEKVVISAGDPCIQGIVMPVYAIDIELADDLDVTSRGEKGFGSSYMADGKNKSEDIIKDN